MLSASGYQRASNTPQKMKKDSSFRDFVIDDLFAEIPGIASRHMFGGWGIYKGGVFFAIISGGELYFKVDNENRVNYETADSHPFKYSRGGKQISMSYWLVPEEVIEDQEKLVGWVNKSVEAGRRSKAK